MSIRPTEAKDSGYSAIETPLTDLELKTKEAKSRYYCMLIYIGIDYIISTLIIIKQSNFFTHKENDIFLFILQISCLTAFFLFVIITVLFLNRKLTKAVKYIYIVIVSLYYIFEISWNVKYFIQHFDESDWLDMLFFFIILLTLIPRLFVFHYMDILILKICEIDDCKKGEEHDEFRRNLENKMERDEPTNWSKTSLPAERKQQSQFLSGYANNKPNKLNNEENVHSIKEKYIEEQDNENNEKKGENDYNNIDNEN